jgi:ribosomal protein S18 acetylase RimI-like enzyme
MVRKATKEDYDSIISIRSEYTLDFTNLNNPDYVAKVQEEGFLIRSYPLTDFISDIKEYFYVYENDGKVVGYIRLKSRVDSLYLHDETNMWMNPLYKDIFFNDPLHAEIDSIAVSRQYKDSDILKQILRVLIRDIKARGFKYLFSSITYAPIINLPYMLWYETNGFEKVCLTTPTSSQGMDNVQGLLYVKELV